MDVKPGYEQTEMGVIPKDWNVTTLGSLCDIVAGRDLVKAHFSPSFDHRHEFPIYSNALTDKGLYGYSNTYQFEANKITVTARGDIGHAAYRNSRFCAIGRLLVLSSKHECDLRFMTEFINNFVDFAVESTGVPQLTAPQISKYTVALPPTKAEQEAIAKALSDADALIECLEQLIGKKRHLKQGAMQELLTGKKRLPCFEVKSAYKQTEVGVIPEDWEVGRLAAICSMKSGESITSANIDQFSKYPCYGGNGRRGFTTRFTHDGRYSLIGRQGALCGNVLGIEGKSFASEHAIVVTASAQTDSGWLTFVLHEMRLNQYSESSAQPGLSVSKLLTLDVAHPATKAEQTAIATILSDMDAEIAALEGKLVKARQLKQGMMQELLTGKTRLI
jgi:type I restriction enzyme S subunit